MSVAINNTTLFIDSPLVVVLVEPEPTNGVVSVEREPDVTEKPSSESPTVFADGLIRTPPTLVEFAGVCMNVRSDPIPASFTLPREIVSPVFRTYVFASIWTFWDAAW
jgi:hypothetical protein